MLSNNIPTAFLVKKSDFLHVSGQSRLNLNAYLIFFLMEDRVTSLNDFCTASTTKLAKKNAVY